jgi:hypothetical protein
MTDKTTEQQPDKDLADEINKNISSGKFIITLKKYKLIWNGIIFLGIITSTFAFPFFTKKDLRLDELFKAKMNNSVNLSDIIIGMLSAFIIGSVLSYFPFKLLKSKERVDFREFITQAYNKSLDRSRLNPKR